MSNDILKRVLTIMLLVLLQALVFNHIRLFNCATPLMYVILPIHFQLGQPRWASLLWCFCIGLLVDIFSNTPGVAAGAMTLVGLIQPYLLRIFVPRETEDTFVPTLKSLGWIKFIAYSLMILLVFNLTFHTFEAFSFNNVLLWAQSLGGSALLTFLMVLALEKISE